jgi:hypothetical protein
MALDFLAVLGQRLQLRGISSSPRLMLQTRRSKAFQLLLAPGSLEQAAQNNTGTLVIK